MSMKQVNLGIKQAKSRKEARALIVLLRAEIQLIYQDRADGVARYCAGSLLDRAETYIMENRE